MGDRPCGYVWGPINAEDLAGIPGTQWIVTSGMTGPGASLGRLYVVHRDDASCSELFPYRLTHALDEARFGVQSPLDPDTLEPHGIDVALRPDGVAEVFVVNHGRRESVEVFEVLFGEARPALRWIGGVEMPGTTLGNDIAAVAGGGFVISTTGDIGGALHAGMTQAAAGGDTGGVLEWSAVEGWRLLPGTGIFVANGVATSPDGEWVFVGGWGARCIKKVRRGVTDPEIFTVPAPIMVDNLTWTRDGKLLAAGAYDTTMEAFIEAHFAGNPRLALPTKVIRIDPDNLAIDVVLDYGVEAFGVGATGLDVGGEIWVGAARDHGLARFTCPGVQQ
jgi:hypothetical protein